MWRVRPIGIAWLIVHRTERAFPPSRMGLLCHDAENLLPRRRFLRPWPVPVGARTLVGTPPDVGTVNIEFYARFLQTDAIFFGHGNRMNAVTENVYTDAWRRIGKQLPRPKAILSISAHWFVPGTGVTISTAPRTIHDFGGFPQELYQVQYPMPGDPEVAHRVQKMLAPWPVTLDNSWGLDHRMCSVLRRVYPRADIPEAPLSTNETQECVVSFRTGVKARVVACQSLRCSRA
jgi:hypothetical protein